MDRKYWENIETKDGHIYHYVGFSASARVQDILVRAQANPSELGYWRDVATDLAALADELELRLQVQRGHEVDIIWCPNCDTEIKLS